MKQPRHLLVEVIAKRTLKINDNPTLVNEIAAYLLAENRVDELESILRDVIEYRAMHGKVEATVISAHELPSLIKNDVKELLLQEYPNADSVVVSEKLDSSVIGGVKVVLPHEQLDLTVRSKLSDFKRLTMAGKE
ncbi:MAG: F0F1 ATP synthase subunit delta [bacterium]